MIIVILIIYIYGALCLKYISGAESFAFAVAYTIWTDDPVENLTNKLGFDPYYLGIIIFAFFSIYFSFGNIENAKTLQVVTMILRFAVTGLMIIGSLIYIGRDGTSMTPVFDMKNQIYYFAKVFGNTTFVFIYHHSISGIVYPIRPQKDVKRMFMWSNIMGALFLGTEALLAFLAFSGRTSLCVPIEGDPSSVDRVSFPCGISDLYNENFLRLKGIGQICNFYPLLNIAAVPILNITLRNNLLDVIPIKRYIREKNCCTFLLDDHKNSVKGIWSIILSLPIIVVVLLTRNVQVMVTYTGGVCGSFILLYFPAMLAHYARKQDFEKIHQSKNPNKSYFQHPFWIYITYAWASITVLCVIVGGFITIPGGDSGGE